MLKSVVLGFLHAASHETAASIARKASLNQRRRGRNGLFFFFSPFFFFFSTRRYRYTSPFRYDGDTARREGIKFIFSFMLSRKKKGKMMRERKLLNEK